MTSTTFINRDQSIAKVNMAMNYLSRLVRENMTIYDYDSQTGEVSFITKSDKLIKGVVVTEGSNVSLQGITIDNATDAFSNQRIDEQVDGSVGDFIDSLRASEYGNAEQSFSKLLNAFEGRSKINEARSKLEKRRGHFTDAQDIVESAEFSKLYEVRDNLISYISENKDDLLQYEDIVNSLKLTNALGKAFNVDRMDWEDILEKGSLDIPYDSSKTVFEMICTQELIRSELTESKENFSRSWVKNKKIAKLASCIYNSDEAVDVALREAVKSVPYLALASKADIKEVFASIYESSDVANISQKDIREYVARVFEFKKPIKQDIISELNEGYGINVQNLKFIPTFANLSKAQSVLFEAMAKIGQKDSVVRDVLNDVAKLLRKKNGIETLDVNDFISEMFSDSEVTLEGHLFSNVDLDSVVDDVLDEKRGDKKGDKSKDKPGDKPDYTTGARKGDKSNVKKDADDEGDYETGARKGDKGDGSHRGRKDYETKKGNSNFGGNKGDKSKTHKGDDYEQKWGGNKGDKSKTHKGKDFEQKWGGNKGDKSKTHAGKDYEGNGNGNGNGNGGDDENGDPRAYGGKKGDKSKTHKGRDYEQKWGGNKGDKSKTMPGHIDYEGEEPKKKDEFPLAKDKSKKKDKKKGGLSDKEADIAADQTAYDESVEYAQPEDDTDFGSGLSDEGMTELMGQLEDLFKEIDWSAVADSEEEEGDVAGSLDFNDDMTERTPNEFSDETVGTPSEDEMP